MMPASVLVVVVNYRTPELALDAIASVEQEVRARGDTHVVVVDNGSGDDSAAILAAGIAEHGFGDWCTLLPERRNGGFAAGNNAGIAWYRAQTGGALPRFTWLLNPDTRAHPGAITALVAFLESHPNVGIAGGRCVWEEGDLRTTGFRFHSLASELSDAMGFGPFTKLLGSRQVALPVPHEPTRIDWVSGASMMIRRELIERIGLMDEGFFLYFEETDFCSRAAAAGFEVWTVPASVITHIGGQSTGVTGRNRVRKPRPRYWFYSRARYFVKRYGAAHAHLINLLWLLCYPLGSLIARVRGAERDKPARFWRDFLVYYYGKGGIMYDTGEMRR